MDYTVNDIADIIATDASLSASKKNHKRGKSRKITADRQPVTDRDRRHSVFRP